MADWKTVTETAEKLEVGVSTLYRWLSKDVDVTGIGLDVRDDGQMLIDVDTVIEYRRTIKRGRPRK